MNDSSSDTYEIVFRGDIVQGETIDVVKQRLMELFNIDAGRAEQLFSGRPVVLKKNLDLLKADQYRMRLENAGAVVQVREAAGAEPAAPTEPASTTEPTPVATDTATEAESSDGNMSLSPVGAEVLAADERRDFTPADIDVDHISVAETGEDVLADDEKKPFIEKQLDLSHLTIELPDQK